MAKRGKSKMNELNSPLSEYPSIHYKKFFDKFADINILKTEEWAAVHILAYICKKYEKYYNMKYTFKFSNTAPMKSYEIYQVQKLAGMLSASPIILKDYIDWVFDKKVIERKKRITSLGYFTHVDIVNEFKFKKLMVNENVKADRSTTLSPKFMKVVNDVGVEISTYGELAFVKRIVESSSNADEKYKKLLIELQKEGFNLNTLDGIK